MAEEIEKIYIIPLKKNNYNSSKAAPTAIKRVKSYLTKHMKVEPDKIWMDSSLNNALWSRGKYNIPSKIRVKAVKFEDGVVEASLPELDLKKSRRELLKEEKEKKTPILRREEEIPEGEGDISGTEDYDIAPAGDGEVKIKKKKPVKKEEGTEKQSDKKDSKKSAKKEKKGTDDSVKSKRKTVKDKSDSKSKAKAKIKTASKSKIKKEK